MAWLAAQDDRPFGFSNCGVSGRTTVNFLPAKAAEYNNVVAAADAAQAKGARLLFSVMLGTNDSAVRGPLGAPVLPEQYHTNMKAIADALLQRYPGVDDRAAPPHLVQPRPPTTARSTCARDCNG